MLTIIVACEESNVQNLFGVRPGPAIQLFAA